MPEIKVTVMDDDLTPSPEREWSETFDNLATDKSWGMSRDELLEKLSECSTIPESRDSATEPLLEPASRSGDQDCSSQPNTS